jgi:hypothetical protein
MPAGASVKPPAYAAWTTGAWDTTTPAGARSTGDSWPRRSAPSQVVKDAPRALPTGEASSVPPHVGGPPDSWSASSRIMCDFVHRGVAPARVPEADRVGDSNVVRLHG